MQHPLLSCFALFLLLCSGVPAHAQTRDFSQWDATAFCSFHRYHPFQYIEVDNNWDIIQALQQPHTRAQLDSLGVKATDSQIMLLNIEGLIKHTDGGAWISLFPALDSLQTVSARAFSAQVAKTIYPKIEKDCSESVALLDRQGYGANAFTILFSYVLDGKIWDTLNTFEDVGSAATWSGACWALYFPRTFSCGTNTWNGTDGTDLSMPICWTKTDFIDLVNNGEFASAFLDDYAQNGRIVSPDLLNKSVTFGLTDRDGALLIPVIDSRDSTSSLNRLSDRIVAQIADEFEQTDIVPAFQQKFSVAQPALARTMLYHETMWDLVDLLLDNHIVSLPALWKDGQQHAAGSVVFIVK